MNLTIYWDRYHALPHGWHDLSYTHIKLPTNQNSIIGRNVIYHASTPLKRLCFLFICVKKKSVLNEGKKAMIRILMKIQKERNIWSIHLINEW